MFIQGNLQVVFDALYSVGAIDPVLGMDWEIINSEMSKSPSSATRGTRPAACQFSLPGTVIVSPSLSLA